MHPPGSLPGMSAWQSALQLLQNYPSDDRIHLVLLLVIPVYSRGIRERLIFAGS